MVAPRAGAWIETSPSGYATGSLRSHPVRVRGLKRDRTYGKYILPRRTPCGCVD